MRKKALQDFYKKRVELRNMEDALLGMQKYRDACPSDLAIKAAAEDLEREISKQAEGLKLTSEDVRRTLSCVPRLDKRIALMLHFYEGYTWDMVGSILQKNPDAIRCSVRRALESVVEA